MTEHYPDNQEPIIKAENQAQAKPEEVEVSEPISDELAGALEDVLSEEDREELAAMEMDEALGYAFTLLLEQGIEDPEAFLKEKGILE